VLAYVFWHRPREDEDAAVYERLLAAFHRSLARNAPAGMLASAAYRVAELPWLPAAAYEDWYLVADYAALGVLNEAAVGRGHRTSHDELARHSGTGAGALYALLEGEPGAEALARGTLAIWVEPTADTRAELRRPQLAGLLADGMEPRHASLWRRQLVLGPAPEYCLIGEEIPNGVRPTRLPQGWHASVLQREVLCSA
jgi:hypothetical protein